MKWNEENKLWEDAQFMYLSGVLYSGNKVSVPKQIQLTPSAIRLECQQYKLPRNYFRSSVMPLQTSSEIQVYT